MKFRSLYLIAGIILLSASCAKTVQEETVWTTDEKIPVLSWYSIELQYSTQQGFMELSECGYTHSLSTVWSGVDSAAVYNADLLGRALDHAHAAGLKVIAGCHELQTDAATVVERFKDHPAVVGWHLKDEPSLKHFKKLGEIAAQVKSVDKDNFIYVNLCPMDGGYDWLGTDDYNKYLEEFVKNVPVDFISFDKYPCMVDENNKLYVLDYWYDNLQIIADFSRRHDMDFWAFASGIQFESVQAPVSLATLRLQMFTNLAYGAQGLQYFVYQNSTSPNYRMVRIVNREIQNFAKVFLGARVLSVTHTGEKIPVNTKRFRTSPDPITYFDIDGNGAVISVLEKGSKQFFVIVSRDLTGSQTVTIAAEDKVRQVTKNGTLKTVRGRVTETLGPGDMLVYMWEK